MSGKLQDKVALVTAAAGAGMGRAIAQRFARDEASFITGETVCASGGRYMHA